MRNATAVTLALCVCWVARRAESGDAAAENPFKKANVGDFVAYAVEADMGGMKMKGKVKQTVTAKDEKTATVAVETEMAGIPPQKNEVKVELDKPHDQVPPGAERKTIKEGDETIKVGGKEYKCHWTETETAMKVPNNMGTSLTRAKVWICQDVPLGGLVKMESTTDITMGETKMTQKMNMELADSGKK
ncbi:MAG: hypothetical protein N3A38_12985 [Planctomycetota bacterium]|nr:hypothetical protein [Planctomycetota bacterium]